MFSRTFIEKTLLDIGGMALDEEPSTENLWQLYVCQRPQLTASLSCKVKGVDRYESLVLNFNNSKFQQMLESSHGQLPKDSFGAISIKTDTDLETICHVVRLLISNLPEDFIADESHDFDPTLDKEDTEIDALAKQRRGQALYRQALEKLWSSRCAVTGISIPEVLRASHAKPWKDCLTGKERIDPYNGFLLTANLDALFDKFLISFSDEGQILIAPNLPLKDLEAMGITSDMRLRHISQRHLIYLAYHRRTFEEMQNISGVKRSCDVSRNSKVSHTQ